MSTEISIDEPATLASQETIKERLEELILLNDHPDLTLAQRLISKLSDVKGPTTPRDVGTHILVCGAEVLAGVSPQNAESGDYMKFVISKNYGKVMNEKVYSSFFEDPVLRDKLSKEGFKDLLERLYEMLQQ